MKEGTKNDKIILVFWDKDPKVEPIMQELDATSFSQVYTLFGGNVLKVHLRKPIKDLWYLEFTKYERNDGGRGDYYIYLPMQHFLREKVF